MRLSSPWREICAGENIAVPVLLQYGENTMIAAGIKVLDEEALHSIHQSALEVLERAGMCVEEPALVDQLRRRGASIDRAPRDRAGGATAIGSGVAIPRELVAECLSTITREPVLYCVNGKALSHARRARRYVSLVTDPYIVDFQEGVRKPRLEDIGRHARLGDALPLIDGIHMMDDTIPDLPSETSVLEALRIFIANTSTSYHCAPGSLRDTRSWIDVAQIMAGGRLKENPILATYVPSVSPLTITEFNTKQLRMFLAEGVLCMVGSCAIAGATAPYPLAGLIVQTWAEFLAMAVAAQTIAPGSPLLGGGGGAHHLDMKSGESIFSGMSKTLASAAMNELCDWIDLPTVSGNFSTLCSNYGVQNGLESALGVFGTFFSRVNAFGGLGSIANACGMSAVQIVLHHELVETLERFREGIDVNSETLAVESICTAGPRGNFLEDPLTLGYLHSAEHIFPPSFEKCAGTKDTSTMAQRAHERAEALIESHTPQIPEDRLAEAYRYIDRKLGK